MLSDSDSETGGLHTLTINEHFAKAFEYKKEREELAKLKEKYGSDYSGSGDSDADNSEDSEDTEEDSDGEELTPAVDAAILRTLARIRKKDPGIYEGDRRVFEEEHTRTQDKAPSTKPKPKPKSKPLTIREAALASALADGVSGSRSPSPEPRPLTHTQEQVLLRSETLAAFHGAVDFEAQGDDDLLIPRSRTRDVAELEEEEYKAFLEREVGEDINNLITIDPNEVIVSEDVDGFGDSDKQTEGKKKKKGKKEREKEKEKDQGNFDGQAKKAAKKRVKKSKEEADQEFLLNYIFNRGWVDRSDRRVPTYNEIVNSSPKHSKRKAKSHVDSDAVNGAHQDLEDNQGEAHGATLSDEDGFDDLTDAFETSYNFRFEEPDGALIASFPRNISSARRESTTRKDARVRKKERQTAEKQTVLEARREEIRQERALVEAAVAAEQPNDEHTLLIENETSSEKKSKKQQRKEELARMKTLKAKELRRKLEMVSSEGGLGSIGDEGLSHLDLDADWDPSKHDAQMAKIYADDGIADDEDAEKPVWDDDIDVDDIVPPTNNKSKAELKKQKKKEKKKKNNKAGEDIVVDEDEMDADLEPGAGWDEGDDDEGEWRGTEEERKRKVDAYMDEVVNRLGFSGITSHMPTRFHYTSTTAESYKLTPAEILLATDAELNSYVGLKKIAPYRVEKGDKAKKSWDPKRVQRLKEFRESLHSRVGSRYEDAWSLDATTDSKRRGAEAHGEKKKRMGKKERAKLRVAQGKNDEEGSDTNDAAAQMDLEVADGSQKRKHDSDAGSHSHAPQTKGELEDVAQRKKRKRRHKKRSGDEEMDAVVAMS